MGHTNSTPNLHLPQFVGSDKPTWLSDVNGAMLAIDNAYGTIEAEASSAATAAAGAVTTAGAAQTAADAAATAAATAGTNASQALSTANNAATVALQAQTDATDALEIASGKVLATVTADGVKTNGEILGELLAAIDQSDITSKAAIRIGVAYYALTGIDGAKLTFSKCSVLSGTTRIDCVVLESNACKKEQSVITGSGYNNYDTTANVATSGEIWTIYA